MEAEVAARLVPFQLEFDKPVPFQSLSGEGFTLMEAEVAPRLVPFQLQSDKPVPSKIKIAEWNPEKDLLAMVTEDSKILLHRFNWQRLWMISPGGPIISICWRPDGKALAVGFEDGTISLHDVENGNLLRGMKCHRAAVLCLYWQEDVQDICNSVSSYEDRTPRFFPPPPRIPRMAGVVSGDAGFMDDASDSFQSLSNSLGQSFNILCSGDKEGCICFSAFGIFPIAKIDVNKVSISVSHKDNKVTSYRMLNASVCKVVLSKAFCHMTVTCSGELVENNIQGTQMEMPTCSLSGLYCLVIRTSILRQQKFELHQMALQAANIVNLNDVIKASLSVMSKQWSDAMHAYHQRFDSFSVLISDQGLDSCPQEEFLSLLGGARMSPALHRFLLNSLGEAGVRRVSKSVCGAGKELQLIVLDHLQPAVELIGFRLGELRGLSKWHARYGLIGLDEALMNAATEKAGMLLVQLERFMQVLSSAIHQFSNFFTWLQKCIKLLVSEQVDPPLSFNSELVVIFLRTLYDQDPVKQLLEISQDGQSIEVDLETMERVRELVCFGGFLDTDYLKRTLAEECQLMESSLKEAFLMPITTISDKLRCIDLLPLFPLPSLPFHVPSTLAYYEDIALGDSVNQVEFLDYMSFRIPDESLPCVGSCVAVIRGLVHNSDCAKEGSSSLEAVVLRIPHGYTCAELAFYREGKLVLLLECSGTSRIMIVQMSELPFSPMPRPPVLIRWALHELNGFIIDVALESEKGRQIPYSVVPPLAVSASRGVACVFAARKRALVYILEEDEEVSVEEV